jgi:putative transposase
MPVHFFRREHSGAALRKLARLEAGRVCQRMLMIANLLDGMEREEAAHAVGLGRQAAFDWHHRYEEEGIAGLRDRPRPGRPPLVPAEVSQALRDQVVAGASLERDGVVAFHGVDVRRLLRERHGIALSLSAVYRWLHRQNLSWLSPRPRHPRSDAQEQAEFRQRLEYNFVGSRRRKRTANGSKCGLPTKPGSARRTS